MALGRTLSFVKDDTPRAHSFSLQRTQSIVPDTLSNTCIGTGRPSAPDRYPNQEPVPVAYLRPLGPVASGLPKRIPLYPGNNPLGRTPGRGRIVLPHVSISLNHANIEIGEGVHFIEDLNSTTGIYLGPSQWPIRPSPRLYQLLAHTIIRIGDLRFTYELCLTEESLPPTQELAPAPLVPLLSARQDDGAAVTPDIDIDIDSGREPDPSTEELEPTQRLTTGSQLTQSTPGSDLFDIPPTQILSKDPWNTRFNDPHLPATAMTTAVMTTPVAYRVLPRMDTGESPILFDRIDHTRATPWTAYAVTDSQEADTQPLPRNTSPDTFSSPLFVNSATPAPPGRHQTGPGFHPANGSNTHHREMSPSLNLHVSDESDATQPRSPTNGSSFGRTIEAGVPRDQIALNGDNDEDLPPTQDYRAEIIRPLAEAHTTPPDAAQVPAAQITQIILPHLCTPTISHTSGPALSVFSPWSESPHPLFRDILADRPLFSTDPATPVLRRSRRIENRSRSSSIKKDHHRVNIGRQPGITPPLFDCDPLSSEDLPPTQIYPTRAGSPNPDDTELPPTQVYPTRTASSSPPESPLPPTQRCFDSTEPSYQNSADSNGKHTPPASQATQVFFPQSQTMSDRSTPGPMLSHPPTQLSPMPTSPETAPLSPPQTSASPPLPTTTASPLPLVHRMDPIELAKPQPIRKDTTFTTFPSLDSGDLDSSSLSSVPSDLDELLLSRKWPRPSDTTIPAPTGPRKLQRAPSITDNMNFFRATRTLPSISRLTPDHSSRTNSNSTDPPVGLLPKWTLTASPVRRRFRSVGRRRKRPWVKESDDEAPPPPKTKQSPGRRSELNRPPSFHLASTQLESDGENGPGGVSDQPALTKESGLADKAPLSIRAEGAEPKTSVSTSTTNSVSSPRQPPPHCSIQPSSRFAPSDSIPHSAQRFHMTIPTVVPTTDAPAPVRAPPSEIDDIIDPDSQPIAAYEPDIDSDSDLESFDLERHKFVRSLAAIDSEGSTQTQTQTKPPPPEPPSQARESSRRRRPPTTVPLSMSSQRTTRSRKTTPLASSSNKGKRALSATFSASGVTTRGRRKGGDTTPTPASQSSERLVWGSDRRLNPSVTASKTPPSMATTTSSRRRTATPQSDLPTTGSPLAAPNGTGARAPAPLADRSPSGTPITDAPSPRVASSSSLSPPPPSPPVIPPIVMITGILDPADVIKKIEKLNGVVTDNWKECTHLVTNKERRTVKYLCAMASGRLLVSVSWINASYRRGYFVDPSDYYLTPPVNYPNEKGGGVFAGCLVYVTGHITKPTRVEALEIIAAARGQVIRAVPSRAMVERCREKGETVVVIGCAEDAKLCHRLNSLGCSVQSVEFLISGIQKPPLNFKK
ncbi:Mediator of DNA damage checkpoint protein 1 [Dimargaris cristalligena]|nr:Mediator of DNA damage checkpoint protein 1 [Dimargaris cristalligena]